jgi:hypothetical protein
MTGQVERRKSVRHRVLKPGRIVFNDGRSTIDCLVRSRSPEGARLKVTSILGIPDQFELAIMSDAPRPCNVVWKSATELGVSFMIA